MERQVGSIPADHRLRYEFAAKFTHGKTLDAACGSGYGSEILKAVTAQVTGIDIHRPTIEYAKKHYSADFICGDLHYAPWETGFQTVVSFETLEHLKAPDVVLRHFRKSCSGVLICSVPNEDLYPFDAEVFKNDEYPHLRHYTPKQFEELVNAGGFKVLYRWCQVSKANPEVVRGTDGRYLIYVCE